MTFSSDITSRGGSSAIMHIHHFVLSPKTANTEGTSSLPSKIDPIILEDARHSIEAVTPTSNWAHVHAPNQKSKSYRPGPVYEYILRPPLTTGYSHQRILLEWGEDLSEEVPEPLEKLSEFECSNLSPKLMQHLSGQCGVPVKHSDTVFKGENTAYFSIHELIPQPHFYSALTSSAPNDISSKITSTFFRKFTPVPIPPYSLDEVNAYLSSPFSRSAWLIPIQTFGCVIYPGSSQAFLPTSSPSQEKVSPAHPKETVACIQWSAAAITAFWKDLLTIRKRGKLGPIGLSYHLAVAPSSALASTNELHLPHLSRNPSAAHPAATAPFPATVPSPADDQPTTIPLLATDHIKIYHDASQMMQLRVVLDAWKPPGQQQQPRILKGCSLVLLDERSKGVLIL